MLLNVVHKGQPLVVEYTIGRFYIMFSTDDIKKYIQKVSFDRIL